MSEVAVYSRVILIAGALLQVAHGSMAEESTGSLENAATPASATSPMDGKIRIVSANYTVDRIVSQLNAQTTSTVRARGKTSQARVSSFVVRDVPLKEVLTQLTNLIPDAIVYEPAGAPDTYELWDQESFRREVLPTLVRPKVFVPKHITSEEAMKAMQGVLTPHVGTAAFDPRSNKVFVTDLPSVLELMQRLLEQIDVSLVTRVFYISHADVNDLAEKLKRLRSPAAPEIIADVRTRQIIVKDRLEKLREMEMLVETLDIGGLGKAAGTPLHNWKVVERTGDSVTIRNKIDHKTKTIRKGEPQRFEGMPGNEHASGRITLKYLSEEETSIPGRVAIFAVQRDPAEIALPLPQE